MNNEVTISLNEFNIIFIESFRYALEREGTWASEDCAKRVIIFWDKLNKSFQEQIQRESERAIETGRLTKPEVIKVWEKVLKLKVKEKYVE